MQSSFRYVFLVNAAAGTGAAPRRLASLLTRFPDLRAHSRIVRSRTAAELDAMLRLTDDEIPVAVGGDGSINALATLMDRRGELARTLGVVPFGTGNATAHTLGLRSIMVAMAALERGTTTPLDVIRTSIPTVPLALVSCSTGFESNFLKRYAALRYRSRQWAGWSALLLNVHRNVIGTSLTLDGEAWIQESERVHNVGLYNIPHYAFGKVMWRGVHSDDGKGIAAEVRSPIAYWNLMARGIAAPTVDTITPTERYGVRTKRWQTAELRSPLNLQVDGESVAVHEATLRVDARALTMIRA